jgi:hypothetical protein
MYADTSCGSTAYSVGTVYGGKEIYILLMLALLCWRRPVASLAMLCWRHPVHPVGNALLAGPGRPCLPSSNRHAAYLQQQRRMPPRFLVRT